MEYFELHPEHFRTINLISDRLNEYLIGVNRLLANNDRNLIQLIEELSRLLRSNEIKTILHQYRIKEYSGKEKDNDWHIDRFTEIIKKMRKIFPVKKGGRKNKIPFIQTENERKQNTLRTRKLISAILKEMPTILQEIINQKNIKLNSGVIDEITKIKHDLESICERINIEEIELPLELEQAALVKDDSDDIYGIYRSIAHDFFIGTFDDDTNISERLLDSIINIIIRIVNPILQKYSKS